MAGPNDVILAPLQEGADAIQKGIGQGVTGIDNVATDAERQAAIGAANAAQAETAKNDAYINQKRGQKSDKPFQKCKICPKPEKKKYSGSVGPGFKNEEPDVEAKATLSGDADVDQEVKSGSYDTYSNNPRDYLYGNPSTTTYYNGMLQPGDSTATVSGKIEGGAFGSGGDVGTGYQYIAPAQPYATPPGVAPTPSYGPVGSGVSSFGPSGPLSSGAGGALPPAPAFFPAPTKGVF